LNTEKVQGDHKLKVYSKLFALGTLQTSGKREVGSDTNERAVNKDFLEHMRLKEALVDMSFPTITSNDSWPVWWICCMCRVLGAMFWCRVLVPCSGCRVLTESIVPCSLNQKLVISTPTSDFGLRAEGFGFQALNYTLGAQQELP